METGSVNSAPTFTQEVIEDLIRDRYSLRAWQSLFSRSWVRSLEDIRKSPARTRSFWSWAAVVGAMGSGVVLLAFCLQTPARALTALAWWLPWYACVVVFLLTHLGMVDDPQGMPHQNLLLPNGLSFIRLALAPLILWPCLQLPVYPAVGPAFMAFLAGLSLLDLLDGWIARRQNLCTRMGSMLDFLADLALLTFLAVGLYLAGAIPGELLLLMLVRYPALLLGVFVIYFVRGPIALRPSFVGKATTFAISIVLLVIAFKTLLQISWPAPLAIEWSVRFIYLATGVNILYLIKRGL